MLNSIPARIRTAVSLIKSLSSPGSRNQRFLKTSAINPNGFVGDMDDFFQRIKKWIDNLSIQISGMRPKTLSPLCKEGYVRAHVKG